MVLWFWRLLYCILTPILQTGFTTDHSCTFFTLSNKSIISLYKWREDLLPIKIFVFSHFQRDHSTASCSIHSSSFFFSISSSVLIKEVSNKHENGLGLKSKIKSNYPIGLNWDSHTFTPIYDIRAKEHDAMFYIYILWISCIEIETLSDSAPHICFLENLYMKIVSVSLYCRLWHAVPHADVNADLGHQLQRY
jgi:hypothetical protein